MVDYLLAKQRWGQSLVIMEWLVFSNIFELSNFKCGKVVALSLKENEQDRTWFVLEFVVLVIF